MPCLKSTSIPTTFISHYSSHSSYSQRTPLPTTHHPILYQTYIKPIYPFLLLHKTSHHLTLLTPFHSTPPPHKEMVTYSHMKTSTPSVLTVKYADECSRRGTPTEKGVSTGKIGVASTKRRSSSQELHGDQSNALNNWQKKMVDRRNQQNNLSS